MSDMHPFSQTTLGILLGASEWPCSKLSSSPAFARSASRVREYFLYSGQFGFRPENWLDLFDRKQSSPYEVDQAISTFLQDRISLMKEAGRPASDLIFYYIGHGMFAFGQDQAYHLAIRSTNVERMRSSAIAMAALAETLKTNARHLRRFVILDCCFAAESFKYMMQSELDQTALKQTVSAFEEKSMATGFPGQGTALLCSSGHKEASLILPDESGTMFSEALIRALHQGNIHQQEKTYLSLYDLKIVIEEVLEKLAQENAPRPFLSSPDQSDGDVASVPFFPNPRAGLVTRLPKLPDEETRVSLVLSDVPAALELIPVSPHPGTKATQQPSAPLEIYPKRSLHISRRAILVSLGLAALGASGFTWFTRSQTTIRKWIPTGQLPLGLSGFRATTLQSGLTLVEGGYTGNASTDTSALFDFKKGIWIVTGSLNVGRYEHSATLLGSGSVLVTGGYRGYFLKSAEMYDPKSGKWTIINSMSTARTRHAATLLQNGKVLVTGGWHKPDKDGLNTAELYNPISRQWSSAGSMIYPHINHVTVQVPDGKVLIIGGDNNILETEFYDPDTNSWRLTKGKLNNPRAGGTAVLLPGNEKVLVIGGTNKNNISTNTAEVFDIATERWEPASKMQHPRKGATGWEAIVLQNHTVLVAGGDNYGTSEIYLPERDVWLPSISIEQPPQPRYDPVTTRLPDGSVLIAGGKRWDPKGEVFLFSSCAIYAP